MNSSNGKSKAFTNGSPWSDKGPQSTSSRKPPRSPPRSPTRRSPSTFVSSDKKGNSSNLLSSISKEEKTFKRCASEAKKSPNLKQNQTHPNDGPTNFETDHLCTPTPDSEPLKNDGCNVSTLSASTPIFVPSQVTLASLNAPKSTGSSNTPGTGYSGTHSPKATMNRTRPRFPTGDELKQMVKVLLHIIDKSPKKRIVFRSSTKHTQLNQATIDSSSAVQASTRGRTRSA
jgi:hypothetical protein